MSVQLYTIFLACFHQLTAIQKPGGIPQAVIAGGLPKNALTAPGLFEKLLFRINFCVGWIYFDLIW